MASSSMASAASGFMVATPNVTSNTAPRSSMLFFSSKNTTTNIPRLIVRAAEDAAPPAATATAEGEAPPAKAAKPPPIGPKRGTKVSSSIKETRPVYLLYSMCSHRQIQDLKPIDNI